MNKQRLFGNIDPLTFQRMYKANQAGKSFPEGAWVCADCFNKALVQDMMQKSGNRIALLISLDALPFLISDINAGSLKSVSDRHSIDDILSADSPFIGSIHISSNQIWCEDGPRPGNEDYYYELEEAAKAREWITDRLSNALVLLRH